MKLVNETKSAAATTSTASTTAQVPTMVPPPSTNFLNEPKIIPLEKDLLEGNGVTGNGKLDTVVEQKSEKIEEMDTDIPLKIPRRRGSDGSNEGKVQLDLDNIEFKGKIDPETGKATDVDLTKHTEVLSTNLARKRLAKFGAPVSGYYAPPSYTPSATVSKPDTSTAPSRSASEPRRSLASCYPETSQWTSIWCIKRAGQWTQHASQTL